MSQDGLDLLPFEFARDNRVLLSIDEGDLLLAPDAPDWAITEVSRLVGSDLKIRNIADEIAERGHEYTAQVLKLEQTSASKLIARQLGLEVGDPVFLSVICHLENKVPVQLEERYVNPDVVPDYLNQDFTRLTPHTYLSRIAPLTEAHHQIEAVLPEQALASHLSIALSEPCLQVLRRTWSKKAAVSYAKLTHPGSRYRLGGHLTF